MTLESEISIHGGAVQVSLGWASVVKIKVWIFDGEAQAKFQGREQWLYDQLFSENGTIEKITNQRELRHEREVWEGTRGTMILNTIDREGSQKITRCVIQWKNLAARDHKTNSSTTLGVPKQRWGILSQNWQH